MDVTNPGLVSVADQVVGNPSTAVDSLAVPREDDVLVSAAGEGYPPATEVGQSLDASSSTFPTPSVVLAGDQVQSPPSQARGQVPGTAPTYAPSPQDSLVDSLAQQNFPGVDTSEFVVAGPSTSLQTNQDRNSERRYVVSSVADADTGGPVVEPATPVSGLFDYVFDAGGGQLTMVSDLPFPPAMTDGIVVSVTGSSQASYDSPQTVSHVTSLVPGTIVAAGDAGGGKVTMSSPGPLPAGLVDGQPVVLATTVAGYDGARVVSGVTNVPPGTFAKVVSAGGGTKIEVVCAALVPAGLVAGKFATLAGGVYAATYKVDSRGTAQGGSFDAAADDGGGGTTFHSTTPLPDELVVGQSVTVAGAVYAGTFVVTAVDALAQTFDLAVTFTLTDVGTWAQAGSYSFVLDVAYSSDDSGGWTCYAFDVAATYSDTATGTWSSYTFQVPGTYVATATGKWTYYPPSAPTTRYRLGVSPADLLSFGVTLVGREVVFDPGTLTVADQGASRVVEALGAGYVVVSKQDPADARVPTLATPQPGDAFVLNVQRLGSETFSEQTGQVTDVVVAPPPPVFVPDAPSSQSSQGTTDVSVGPQPGTVLVTSGTQVPTARDVYVADQATSVGLPVNVYV